MACVRPNESGEDFQGRVAGAMTIEWRSVENLPRCEHPLSDNIRNAIAPTGRHLVLTRYDDAAQLVRVPTTFDGRRTTPRPAHRQRDLLLRGNHLSRRRAALTKSLAIVLGSGENVLKDNESDSREYCEYVFINHRRDYAQIILDDHRLWMGDVRTLTSTYAI